MFLAVSAGVSPLPEVEFLEEAEGLRSEELHLDLFRGASEGEGVADEEVCCGRGVLTLAKAEAELFRA